MIVKQSRFTASAGWVPALPTELDSAKSLVLVFAAPSFARDQAPLVALQAAFPSSHIIGCSTAGEIFGEGVADDSIVVSVTAFERDTALRSAFSRLDDTTMSFEAGRALVAQLAEPSLRAIFVLSNGVNVNGSELVRGLKSGVSPEVAVIGGLAGDGAQFQATWVLGAGGVAANGAVAIGLYGTSVSVGYGSAGGWRMFGIERRVTRAEGNVLFELDHRPALTLYKEYLGNRAADLPGSALLFPLSLRAHHDDTSAIVRTILGVDEATQSMRFAGDIPEGSLAQLMRTTTDLLVDGAETAATLARASGGTDQAGLAIAVSCVGRRLVLGQRSDEETEATLHALPRGSSQIGFYSYGEISPVEGGFCDLHNQTMTISFITEA